MPEKIPETLEEAVAIMKDWPDVEAWAKDPDTGEPTDGREACAKVHHGGGTSVRNNWGLWTGSLLARHLHERFGLTHADDMSGLLFRCLHRELNGLPWEPENEVARYKAYWDEHGGQPPVSWEPSDVERSKT